MDSRVDTVEQQLRILMKQHTLQKMAVPHRTNVDNNSSNCTDLTAEIVELIINTDPAGVGAAVCVSHLTEVFTQTTASQCLQQAQLQRLSCWLQTALETQKSNPSNVLAATSGFLRLYPNYATGFWERLCAPKYANIIQHSAAADGAIGNEEQHNELLVATLQCMDVTLNCLLDIELSEQQLQMCEKLAADLVHLHYLGRYAVPPDSVQYSLFLLQSLLLLNRLATLPIDCMRTHVSELLGLAKAYMFYGLNSAETVNTCCMPQKVHASQQMLYDSAEEVETLEQHSNVRNCGGKMAKSRKPRAAKAKARQQEGSQQQRRFVMDDAGGGTLLAIDFKTSDSDTSERESADNRRGVQRHLSTRIRHAAIVLLGAVARAQERRVLYSYWHAIFPSSNESSNRRDDLLQVSRRDPNARCRSTSLQIASQLLLGSKGFLSQAEYQTRTSSAAFLPFAQSLGISVLAMYEALTAIIANESALPVLTQVLKCLALLVQATPFQRFECKFASRFIQHVRKLSHHRDATIQVSALMVMEFLFASTELTTEIAEALGLPKASLTASKEVHQTEELNALIELGSLEHLAESDDSSSDIEADSSNSAKEQAQSVKTVGTHSWLLVRVLHNLDYATTGGVELKVPTAVRIESLQVLSSMAAHFKLLLNAQLERTAVALEYALRDNQSDVRLHAARTLDACAYQMSRFLSEQLSTLDKEQLDMCIGFWARILPVAMERIHGAQDELAALKVHLCDALSNIGATIFERLSHGTQMNLLSFLSGISSDLLEEMIVRAAAARALAVFVLFPSLRDNLVFIENTAELTLRLVDDSNLLVRIKVFWSMGNVSDALLSNSNSATHERISDELLKRLIEASGEACSGNDKVRCNAVRTLGNLLRLLTEHQLNEASNRQLFQKSINKLIECIRSAGNAKVKWNSCYAIGNLMRNEALFAATAKYDDLNWQAALYPALCHVIVHHANFKVRINATAAIQHIGQRAHFGAYFELFWRALLEAIECSQNLQNFYEYNHRDQLQEQICLAMCHLLNCASAEDFPLLKRLLVERLEVIQNTWTRVTNRMLPEKSAPLQACSVLLRERLRTHTQLGVEQKNAITIIAQTLTMRQ